jgi:hypothetical protein
MTSPVWVVVGIAIVAVATVIAWWRNRKRAHPFLSIALFLTRRRSIDDVALRQAAETAWNVRFSDAKDATEYAVGSPPVFMASAHGCIFLVNALDRNYYGAGPEPDPDAPPGIPAHVAFLSVDFLKSDGPRTDVELYRMIGRLVDALLGEDCAALFLPPSRRLLALDTPEHVALVREALRADDVLGELSRLMAEPAASAA